MRSTMVAAIVALFVGGQALGQDLTVCYELELGGDNHADDWKNQCPPTTYTPGSTSGGDIYQAGDVINWAARVTVAATGGAATHGAANLVFDLELLDDQGQLVALSAASGTGCGNAGWCSTIQDDTGSGCSPFVPDVEAKAAFAVAYDAWAEANFTAPGDFSGRLIDPLPDDGPGLDFHTFPSADGFPTGSTADAGTLVGMGAGYSAFTRAGFSASGNTLSGVGCVAGSCGAPFGGAIELGAGPAFEGQINTTGLSAGTYTLRLVATVAGNNVLKDDFDPFGSPGPVPSFATGSTVICDNSGGAGNFGPGEGGDIITFTIETGEPQIVDMRSRKTHGGAGDFDLQLAMDGISQPVEPRTGGADRVIIVLDGPQALDCGDITLLSGSCGGLADLGGQTSWELTINGAAPNACQVVTVAASKVTGPNEGVIRNIEGDANLDGNVTAGDMSLIKTNLFAPVTSGNFTSDINHDGNITAGDMSATKTNLFAPVSPCP